MQHKNLIRIIVLILSVSMFSASLSASGFYYSYAEDDVSTVAEETTASSSEKLQAQRKLEAQKKEFEKNIAELEKKLQELASESKETEEYIDTLDEKIGYVNQQLTILDDQINSYVEEIDALQAKIDEKQAEVDALQAEVDAIQQKVDELNAKFQETYDAYCARMRAVYMAGSYSIIEALLMSKDLASFFTRYEMVRAVSKTDSKFLKEIEDEVSVITAEESELNQKIGELDYVKSGLYLEMTNLEANKKKLTDAQESITKKKIQLASDKAESDKLLAELNEKNGMYSEFRNEDEAVKKAVEAEIEAVINGIKNPEDVTLATTSNRDDVETTKEYVANDVYDRSDGVYNMTYPVPNHYSISAGYPNYSSGEFHGGIDFPCSKGTKVVAAQSGVVSLVKNLGGRSYGYYVMIYHGTDESGNHIFTLYAHNSDVVVSVGDSVYKGQQIAKSGSTGNSTGPHCHFEVRINSKKVNPTNYLSK